MSQKHLDAFLADVKRINPKFKESTSSLSSLIGNLRKHVRSPKRSHVSDKVAWQFLLKQSSQKKTTDLQNITLPLQAFATAGQRRLRTGHSPTRFNNGITSSQL